MINDKNIVQKVKQYTSNLTMLIVENDPIALKIHQGGLKDLFASIETVVDGKEAYDKWLNSPNGYDLILTDTVMPNMDGYELIKKIREKSVEQKFMVLSAVEDMSEMRDIINLGIDRIITKPYNLNHFLTTGYLAFKYIYNNKRLKTQFMQLKLLSQKNVDLQKTIQKNCIQEKKRETKITKIDFKKESVLIQKYHTRETLIGEKSSDLSNIIDYSIIDRIDDFQDNLIRYEALVCSCSFTSSTQIIRKNLAIVYNGLGKLVDSFNTLGKFPVALNAAENLIVFLENLSAEQLFDREKKELMIDMLVLLLQDINEWLIMVFIKQETDNINYFDASFANSCLEIEAIFNTKDEEIVEEEVLEFF